MKKRVLMFLGVFLLLAALAMIRTGRIFGEQIGEFYPAVADTASVVNTTELASDVTGYGGPLPVNIHLTGNRIDSVEILPNEETPVFLQRLYDEGLVSAWDGKTLAEADTMKVDAVSGATYSSKALIANVHAGVASALEHEVKTTQENLSTYEILKWLVVLLVIICAGILPFFTKNKKYRLFQQLLNVAILGFWAGTFVDYAMMINFFSNFFAFTIAGLVTIALLLVAFVFPLFGSKAHYCNWVCPYGSLQDLAGRLNKKKIKMSPGIISGLNLFRRILWALLMILLAAGWGAEWINYEIFSAFVVECASWIVITVGILFILLSIFIPRPFCRFVCPTGTLLKAL